MITFHGWVGRALALAFSLSVVPPVGSTDLGAFVAIPIVPIQAGDIVTEHMLASGAIAEAATSARAATRDFAVGRMARRTLLPNRPIPIEALRVVPTVRAGEPVRLIYRAASLHITAVGTALSTAGPGEVIQARNSDSGALVRGTVRPDNSILVDGS